jgi:4-amino-4-deoxy-L-arabinose transferase-like glycosyltransferase
VTLEPRRPWRWPPELWLLLVLAAAVRFYGLRFGMPHVWARPDELVVCDIAQRFLTGDLNPHFWAYPTLFMYLLAALDYGFYLFGRSVGWFRSLEHFVSSWHVEWTPFFMIARIVSATAGAATVVVVHRLSARLFDRVTAGVAALFLALAFLHVRDSHFGVTDVTMTFCVALSFFWLVRGVLEDRTSLFALAGAVAGAGASIKYNVVLMAAPLAAAVFVSARGRWRLAAIRVAWFGLLFVIAFVAGSPYSVIEPQLFLTGLLSESKHVALSHGIDVGHGGLYHIVFSLRYGLGVPLLAAGIGGLVWLFRFDWRKAVLVASFPVVHYLLLAPTRTVFVRYTIPLVPFLCVSAAGVTVATARAIARRFRIPAAPAAIGIALLVLAPSAVSVAQIDRLFAATDSRLVLADWIRANVRPGSSVYFAGNIVVQPIVDLGSIKTLRYWTHRAGRSFDDERRPVAGIPEWLVIPETVVPEYSYCPPDVRVLARERYDVVQVIKAMELEGNLFDLQDAFYYPYAGFHDVRRGGPNYVVYARKPSAGEP